MGTRQRGWDLHIPLQNSICNYILYLVYFYLMPKFYFSTNLGSQKQCIFLTKRKDKRKYEQIQRRKLLSILLIFKKILQLGNL